MEMERERKEQLARGSKERGRKCIWQMKKGAMLVRQGRKGKKRSPIKELSKGFKRSRLVFERIDNVCKSCHSRLFLKHLPNFLNQYKRMPSPHQIISERKFTWSHQFTLFRDVTKHAIVSPQNRILTGQKLSFIQHSSFYSPQKPKNITFGAECISYIFIMFSLQRV